MSISRTLLGVLAATTVALSVTACTPPNQNDSTEPTGSVDPGEVLMTSQAPASSRSAASTTSGSPAGDVEITVTPERLTEGGEVTFEITGLDPDLGYYAAICAATATPGNPVPVCTGQQMDQASQAWLSNSAPGATDTISDNGSANVTLVASAVGEGLDCTIQECVAKVFGDHTEGFRDVADTPVTFAAALNR
ncbi:thiamine biosynthesis protein [Corynebacterium pacaense]|uniref:thiamine biosynthesis protein n=1 Tax=Corynebacterium pacaense TaxID=1816684 RepID=UPI0009B9B185|nr:thiamine biosynthesis protein [Corynebacterium pacaense]